MAYRAVVSYADCEGETHRHLITDIKAYNMLKADDLAVDDFVDSYPSTKIGKIEVCGVCGEVGNDLEYDEHMDRFVCCNCDVEREIEQIQEGANK